MQDKCIEQIQSLRQKFDSDMKDKEDKHKEEISPINERLSKLEKINEALHISEYIKNLLDSLEEEQVIEYEWDKVKRRYFIKAD